VFNCSVFNSVFNGGFIFLIDTVNNTVGAVNLAVGVKDSDKSKSAPLKRNFSAVLEY